MHSASDPLWGRRQLQCTARSASHHDRADYACHVAFGASAPFSARQSCAIGPASVGDPLEYFVTLVLPGVVGTRNTWEIPTPLDGVRPQLEMCRIILDSLVRHVCCLLGFVEKLLGLGSPRQVASFTSGESTVLGVRPLKPASALGRRFCLGVAECMATVLENDLRSTEYSMATTMPHLRGFS